MQIRPRVLALTTVITTMALLTTASPVAADAEHPVAAGETLSEIAERYGVGLTTLASANGILDPNRVLADRTLAIPPFGRSTAASHTVVPGESLSAIALRHRIPLPGLIAANGITNADFVMIGRVLDLPAISSVDDHGTTPLPRAIRAHPGRVRLADDFLHWATTYEVPVDLLMALAYVESGWQSDRVSSAGAVGVGQLMPDTIDLMRDVLLPGVDLDPLDPADSIRMAARYLRYLRHRTATWDGAIGAYFQGLVGLRRDGLRPATADYVVAVSANRSLFSD